MLDFEHQVSTEFVFGKNAELKIGEKLSGYGFKKVLAHHTGDDFLQPLLARIKGELEKNNIEVFELDGVEPNPRLSLVRKGVEIAREEEIDFVLAVGGGSTIDSAKAIAAGARYDGDVWDLFTGKGKVESALKIGVVLTYPASGSESGNVSVINNTETNEKILISSRHLAPMITFMNPELTYTLPVFLTANGVVDMFSHICERYFSPATYIGVIDRMAEGALRTLVDIGVKAIKNPEDYRYRAELMWIGTIAQNDTLGVGRVQDWATHVIGNELSALYDITHGMTLSAIMPSWMRYVYQNDIPRFARYAEKVFDVKLEDEEKQALEGIRKTEEFFVSLGMPVNLKELFIKNLDIDKLAASVQYNPATNTIGSIRKLDINDVKNILTMAYEG
ncbi:MAG: iron-containing alcohol dehydrogenase [Halanaerobiales bacterium]